ncbi:MAG: MFS transporter [Hyphomonadaceae bacterium]|nr:MFS transporter [Hyphomonadaceae bacterium]
MVEKVAYGAGMLGNQMFPAALGVFMVVLVQGLGFPALLWGLLFFLPRLLDAILDPIMGFITDNTRSKYGRRKPYIILGAIIAGLSYIAMWQLYETNSLLFNFTYFLIGSLIFYVGLTVFATPYIALGYEMSNDFHERTRLMAVAQWIGQWAWVIVPWFWPLLYNPNLFDSPAEGVRIIAIWVGLGCMALAIIPAIIIKTPSTKNAENLEDLSLKNLKNNQKVFLSGFSSVLKLKPFRKLCAATLLVFSSFQTVGAFTFFIVVHHLFAGDAGAAGSWPAWFGTISALATCFLVIPVITIMSMKLGKKTTFLLTQAISIIGYALFWWFFQPGNPIMMLVPIPFYAFGIGGLFTLMMSMTADVCDLDELNTGARREGTFGALYWLMVKFGVAIAGALSGVIMWVTGFDANAATQAEGAMDGMRLAYSIVPIVGALLAIWIMWDYDVTEERADTIRDELDKRNVDSVLA